MIVVFTNIPNPYNVHLWGNVRAQGVQLRVVYKGLPHSEARPWSIQPDPGDHVAGTLRSELSITAQDRPSNALLSGGYVGRVEVLRRLAVPRRAERTHYWGERLSRNRRLLAYRRWYFGNLDSIFAIGTWARSTYEAVVPPGLPVHVLPYTTAMSRVPRATSDQPTIGFVGSLIQRKGVDLLLQALRAIPSQARPRLEIAGSGPLRAELKTMAVDLGVDVEWLGELDPAAIDQHRARWSAVAVPSRYDGWGVVVSEAMAAGVPAIVSPHVGAGHDLVRHGFNGCVAADEAGWTASLKRYCNPAVTELEGKRARVVGEELSSATAAAWLLEVLNAPGGPPRDFVAEGWARVYERCPDGLGAGGP